MQKVTMEERLKPIKEAIKRGDAEVRDDRTLFVHRRAAAAQQQADTLAEGAFEREGPGAVFVLPTEFISKLVEEVSETGHQDSQGESW